MSYRNTVHLSVGVSPFQALYGRSGRLPSQNSKSPNGFCTEADRTQTLFSSWDLAKENQKSHERNQQRSTKRQDANVLAPETSVMLLKPGLLSSLEPRWTPRWAIVSERHPTYWVRHLPTSTEKVIHRSRI